MLTHAVYAQEATTGLPLWEAGVGAGGLSLPAYAGSAHQNNYFAPLPYFVYRGDIIKAQSKGLRADIFKYNQVELTLSASGSLPSKSANTVRQGMADLPLSIELGPEMQWHLLKSKQNGNWIMGLPVRNAWAVTSAPQSHGWVFNPYLEGDGQLANSRWRWGMRTGLHFQDRHYNQFHYGVASGDVTETRPAYQAKGGYAGASLQFSLRHQINDFIFSGFVDYRSLAGATFTNSPLIEKKGNVYAGISVIWVFDRSKIRVKAGD